MHIAFQITCCQCQPVEQVEWHFSEDCHTNWQVSHGKDLFSPYEVNCRCVNSGKVNVLCASSGCYSQKDKHWKRLCFSLPLEKSSMSSSHHNIQALEGTLKVKDSNSFLIFEPLHVHIWIQQRQLITDL